jgi:hypothetical protein
MKLVHSLTLSAALSVPLAAQVVDQVGGAASSLSGSNLARGNLFRVDSSRMLVGIEAYLALPGTTPRNLEFFVYRHHSAHGTGGLVWQGTVGTPAAGAARWHASGTIAVPLVAGNTYAIGVGWSGSATYYWNTATAFPTPVSFGAWVSGRTLTSPPPATLLFSHLDIAQFAQRLTTVPLPGVSLVGAGCGGILRPPRVVASTQLRVMSTTQFEVADGAPWAPAVLAFGLGPALSVPVPMFGCSTWLQSADACVVVMLSAAGDASLPVTVPFHPGLTGMLLTVQAAVVGGAVDVTNAVEMTVQG